MSLPRELWAVDDSNKAEPNHPSCIKAIGAKDGFHFPGTGDESVTGWKFFLIDWILSPISSNPLLAEALAGRGGLAPVLAMKFSRHDSPALFLYEAIKGFNDPALEKLFKDKLAVFVSWIAADSSQPFANDLGSWTELFWLINEFDFNHRHLDITISLWALFSAFDNYRIPPLKGREIRRTFTSLLMHRQVDNKLRDRWLKLTRDSNSDKVLYASAFDAVEGLLACPDIDTELIRASISNVKDRINQSSHGQSEKMTRDSWRRFLKKIEHNSVAYYEVVRAIVSDLDKNS